MSLFKSVAKSVVGVGKEGYKTGKRLSRLAQLNLTLKLERDKQRNYYKEIGEHVHNDQIEEKHISPKIKVLREKIVFQERKIKGIVEEINRLKQLSRCTYCGYVSHSWNGSGGEHCPKCLRSRK